MGLPRLKQSPSEHSHTFLDIYIYIYIHHLSYIGKTSINKYCKKC